MIMKKITLTLAFLLTMIAGGYAQVSYQYGWEPTVIPLGGWTTETFGFSRVLITPCSGDASARANTYLNNARSLTSPLLGISNGGVVDLTFDYKVMDWSANTVATAANQVSIAVEWSNGAAGPWFLIETIGEANHEESTSCASKNFQFSPTPGNLYVRFSTISVNGADVYYYFDNVNLTQGPAPTCVSPSNLLASAVTVSAATISWSAVTPAPANGYEFYYSDVNAVPAASGTATTILSADLTLLNPNTNYYFWVRSMCGTGSSVWSGPIIFRTLCVPFGDFTQNFDTSTVGTGLVPTCWFKTLVSTNAGVNVSVISNTAASAPNAIVLSNAGDLTAQVILATPSLTAIGANTHRMTFKARGGVTAYPLILGTMSNPTDASTFVELQTYVLTNSYATYNVTLNTSTTANFIAFKHGLGGTFRSIYIDDVIWEPIPTAIPLCIANLNAVANEGCGNFPTTFTWSAVTGADGYTVSIGTSENGANLVVDNLNINSALNYSFAGNPGTTYYYTIRPYNANGPATGCFEDSFTTYDDGCYCVAVPTVIDNSGVTNVSVGDTNFAVTAVTYADLTENGAVEITRGINTIMNITLATGYSYATNVWVDFNDNYTFEPSELVFTGPEGSNAVPTIVNTSFLTPLTAALGEHRMRIVTTDNPQNPANPCYGDSYGVVIDLLVDVQPAPACLPPSASSVSTITASGATLNWVSAGTLFNVEYDFIGFQQGTGTTISAISSNSTTLTDLDPQADYAYYLQTNCGSGSLSPWTGPFTFRTACASFGNFTQDFTTDVNITAPECWYTLINSTVSTPSVSNNSFNDYIALSTSGNAAAVLYLITPSLTDLPLDTHRIKFKARGPVGTSITVGTMSDPNMESTFSAVQSIQLNTTLADYAVTFLNSTTNTHLAIRFAGTATFQTVVVDDVVWENAPDCPIITIINATESTATTTAISWAPGGAETAWQYAFALASVGDPSGLTPVDVTPNPNATIVDLQSSSTYKIWVRAVCTSGFGEWSSAKTFTTACAPISAFPWTEGFENATVGFNLFPLCWFKENGDYSTAVASTWNTALSGTNYLRNNWSATNEYMWTPGFELTAGTSYDFSFYMQGDGFTGWTVDVFQNTVQNSVGATQLGGTTTASGTGSYVIQPYALVNNTIVPITTGTYYFAIRVNQPSGSPWYIAFDDFKMELTPSCIAPLAPTVTAVTATSATINWAATVPASANGYDYFISNTTVAPDAATAPTGSVAAGITTVDLMALSSSSVYRSYVRSICGTDDFSAWSSAGLFTTSCAAFDAPFLQNFDAFLPLCWATAAVGTIETGPTGTAAGIWAADGFLNAGSTGAVKANLYSTNRIGWIISPEMTTTVGTEYTLSFNYGVTAWNQTGPLAMGSDDFVKIAMSADNGVTWTEIHTFNAASNVTNLSQTFSTAITATTSQVRFAFVTSDGIVDDDQDYDFFIDSVAFDVTLSNTDFNSNTFTAYPNPVKDILNVSFEQNISDVTVYNLLGQQVAFKKMNADKGQIDLSNLAAGTYLVRVNTENAVKTIKVIKQ
jgi:hypothetical protein